MRYCKENELNVWIYDENGYPSGRAGEITLDGNPQYAAKGLFYDFIDFIFEKNGKEFVWKLPDGIPYYVAI